MSKSVGESDGWLLYGPYRMGEENGRARWMVRPPRKYGQEQMLFFVNTRQLGKFFKNIKRNAINPKRNLRRAYEIARRTTRENGN